MEKFAIDLDKVLDEFEFNEDRAEQVASVAPRQIGPSIIPVSQGLIPKTHNRPTSSTIVSNEDLNVIPPPPERHKDERPHHSNTEESPLRIEREKMNDNLASFRKAELKQDNVDSINHFYTHGRLNDSKIQPKQCVESQSLDPEPVSIIHNDISQKLLQKKLNDNSNSKVNSYDNKLNQSHMKPSVSNVFSSLNEYINAPSGSLVTEENPNDSINVNFIVSDNKRKDESVLKIESTKDCTVIKNITTDTGSISVIKNDIGVASTGPKLSNAITLPPKYQNILLPIKLDTCIEKPSNVVIAEHKIPENVNLPETSKSVNIERNFISQLDKTERQEAKSIIDEPENVYENVYIGTDIPKTQGTINKLKNLDTKETKQLEQSLKGEEEKHTYENIDFPSTKIRIPNKDSVYEYIFLGNREQLPETTTELEVAAKKLDQFYANKKNQETELEIQGKKIDQFYTNKKSQESETKGSNTTRLVFQAVQLNPPPQEHKPIGFGNIDDLSEEELNRFLAELEEEERVNEASGSDGILQKFSNKKQDDEDANEAPIFESVVIGELPSVSEEDLQQKAKKFPVIDYSKGRIGESSSGGSDFLAKKGVEKFHESTKPISKVKEDKGKTRKSKKTNEKIRKCSDNFDISINETVDEIVIAQDKENGNCISEIVDTNIKECNNKSENDDDFQNITNPGNNLSHDLSLDESGETDDDDEEDNDDNNDNGDDNKLLNPELNPHNDETGNLNVNENMSRIKMDDNSSRRINDVDNNLDHNENSEEDLNRPTRPQTLDIVATVNMTEFTTGKQETVPVVSDVPENEGNGDEIRVPSPDISENSSMDSGMVLGKQPPFWIPDAEAPNCMLCDVKFNVIKRRHHCRACGKVLCSKCCNMKYRLEYQGNIDSRVCLPCYQLLIKAEIEQESGDWSGYSNSASGPGINSPQLVGGLPPPPTVMVPVGVLKREGSTKQRSEGQKSVMFSDGIRPGCDLTELDTSWDLKPPSRKVGSKRIAASGFPSSSNIAKKQNLPPLDPNTNSYIPQDANTLPPTVNIHKGQITYTDVLDQNSLFVTLKNECEPAVMFAINRNLYAYIKIINLSCCMNKICWNITSKGLACVGQDEVIFLIETLPDETQIPKDVLIHINQIYMEATKGNTITENGVSIHQNGNLLGSREHAGFLFIRQTLQCLQKIVLPPSPFLVGLLVHRWETPWAKVFPLRLVLRLGAEYRYYPCPLVSVRFREAVYFEIGQTVMKVLADFRNFAYTLPAVRGLTIHMEGTTTFVRFPKNRYDQVIKGLNNSNDHVLAFAANFSVQADSHLVCIQTNSEEESSYQTQAINIEIKPRKVTGASFIVINGALKSSMGLSAKTSIVEDGLMVQIMPEKLEALKAALKNMQEFTIGCGRQGAPEPDEVVNITWVENDVLFNLGVKSPIDGKPMDGVPSIRVHNGVDYVGTSRFIRWTEVFIVKSDDHPNGVHDPVDINKLSENIARATCTALVKLLDLLAAAGLTKLAVRTTIHPDNVGYEAGSEGTRLPPIYMNSLDNELIQVLQKAVQSSQDTHTVLELVFYILESENYCV
ncbi:zinc finger FYVE domain-containing protein 9 isoform X3 [Leptopilina boulardi]|uniref:zinc finger FYVE domain-containing protein 9 isoform X3 n=1 Tax=Leptopilina boulardi TaxID=63433 RepID=UPI0021F6496C|nr:zinc finger FYVE domain-containing protein 9 isoform X3 [Leptopilina boulardi]